MKLFYLLFITLVAMSCKRKDLPMTVNTLTSTIWDMGKDHYYEYLIFNKDGSFKGQHSELGGEYDGKYYIIGSTLFTYVDSTVSKKYTTLMSNGFKSSYIFVGSGLKKYSSKLGNRNELRFTFYGSPSFYPKEMTITERRLDKIKNNYESDNEATFFKDE